MSDIKKLLTLGLMHISHSTQDMLQRGGDRTYAGDEPMLGLVVAEYGDFGWFIWAPPDNTWERVRNLPADLAHIFSYANLIGADYVLLDMDAECDINLPIYSSREDH